MRFFTARSLSLAALVPALVLFLVTSGCAKQSEGERCGDSLGAGASDDCGDGLTCTLGSTLAGYQTADGANRCCYADGPVTDSRCEPKGDSTPSDSKDDVGGSGGTGGLGGGGGSIEPTDTTGGTGS